MIISGFLFGAQFRLFPILFIVLVTMVLTQIVGMLYGKARYGFEVRSSFFWSVNWRALFLNVLAGVGLILLYMGTHLSMAYRGPIAAGDFIWFWRAALEPFANWSNFGTYLFLSIIDIALFGLFAMRGFALTLEIKQEKELQIRDYSSNHELHVKH